MLYRFVKRDMDSNDRTASYVIFAFTALDDNPTLTEIGTVTFNSIYRCAQIDVMVNLKFSFGDISTLGAFISDLYHFNIDEISAITEVRFENLSYDRINDYFYDDITGSILDFNITRASYLSSKII